MSYYRKYRPQTIDEIDNESVRTQLLSLMNKDRGELPHAYFFTGPKGTGKTTSARVIAKLFNCLKSFKSGPCGACEQCTAISQGTSMDVIEMDAASNRGIDEIRQLRERIGLSPVSASYTIYIIDEVHMLTTEAFNALLKTLEEPPKHAVFVLATTDAHKVPATIKSRCMEFNFHKASQGELLHALERITKAEKIDISKDGLVFIAGMADGSFRDAVKVLEQATLANTKITEETLQKLFSAPQHFKLEDFWKSLREKRTQSALEYIDTVAQQGVDPRSFLTFLLQDLHRQLLERVKGNDAANSMPLEAIQRLVSKLSRAYEEVRYSPLPQLPLELVVVEFCTETAGASDSGAAAHGQEAHKSSTRKPVEEPAVLPAPAAPSVQKPAVTPDAPAYVSLGFLTLEKLVEHWQDFIAATKPYNHSVAGVLRSSRPKTVEGGIVTVEAFYKFHQEKLADSHTKQVLSEVLKKLFGEKVKIEIVLGKK